MLPVRRLLGAQQKIVIKVQMSCDKCRSKAMEVVAATLGVDSVAIDGEGRDKVVVVGDGVDSIKLTGALRKKVGPAHLLQVGEAKKDDKKPPPAVVPAYYPPPHPVNVVYDHPAGYPWYGYQAQHDTTSCSIM